MLHTTPIFPSPACPASPAGHWLEIIYDASLIEDAKRPALVITNAAGVKQSDLAPAPVLGRAIWIGRIPPDAKSVHLESAQQLRLASVTGRSLLWRLSQALRRHPRHLAAAAALACLGRTSRARRRLARALTESPLRAYSTWSALRRRPHEPDGIDKPVVPRSSEINMTLAPGETLTPWALDAVSAAFAADPSLSAVQGDSEVSGPTAGFASAWTPALGPVFSRTGSTGTAVRRLRTILTYHPARNPAQPTLPPEPDSWPAVTVIVPTRDRLDLLRTCVTGVLTGTNYPGLTLIIADNDSAEPETRAYLQDLPSQDARVRVVPCPGPFNFSAINNRATAASKDAILVFLNNDIAIKHGGWLKALVIEALNPGTGAVGATLLYENGRIQHAGVALGPGGTAGHILRDKPISALAGISGPRLVSAVTGACLVVERGKFDAVGGFDEAFPVEYNDIDLCLRLNARGWGAIWSPETMLIHRESASRAKGHANPASVALFRGRWMDRIADDPHFHPAFSDSALDLSLG